MPQLPDDPKSDQLNPSARGFENLANLERNTSNTPSNQASQGGNSQQQVADQERQPRALNDSAAGKAAVGAASAAAGTVGTPLAAKAVQVLGRLKTKKSGFSAVIIGLIILAVIVIANISSSGLLLTHVVETLTEKFDTQLASFDRRVGRMYINKLDNTTNGLCTTIVSLRCRYSTMSQREIDRFKKAGITVNYDQTTAIRGRAKPTSFEFTDPGTGTARTITASNFRAEHNTNPQFRLMLRQAYNPRFVGYSDFIFKKVSNFFNINKRKVLTGDTDAERAKEISDKTKGTNPDGTARRVTVNDDKPDGSGKYTQAEVDEINKAADFADEIAAGASGAGSAFKRVLAGAANAFKVTGWADNACGIYGTIKAIGYAGKVVLAAQLVRYAWVFYNAHSQIKDGTATPGDAEYLGNILTTVERDSAGNVITQAATDSYGYKYAAYGDTGPMPDSAMQFMAGGGLSGSLTGITSTLNRALGGTPNKTCGFLRNPWVSGASLVAGVALMLIPGVNVVWSVKTAVVAAGNVAFELALAYLPALLQDKVAGKLVDPDDPPVGEEAGNILAAGGGELAGRTAQFGGNAPMTIDQAVSYERLRGQVQAAYAEEERLARSPFDITSRYTLAGSMVAAILPSMSSSSSAVSSLSSVSSLFSRSVTMLSPSAHAITAEQHTQAISSCSDPDYSDIAGDGSNQRIATTPFCNVIYGIPPEWLDIPTTEPLAALAGQYDEETGEPIAGSSYDTFAKNCINRTTPLGGIADPDQQTSSGAECVASESNKWYYLAWIDRRVAFSQDEEDVVAATEAPVQQTPTVPGSGNWANPNDFRVISSIYGGSYYRSIYGIPHKGTDLMNRAGNAVYSACDGVILHIIPAGVKPNYGEYTSSNTIVVDCGYDAAAGGNITTGYHHTQPVPGVHEGMQVSARTLIGRSDCSGLCSGAHLHFNVRINGEFTDPVPFMQARGVDLGSCRPGNKYCV